MQNTSKPGTDAIPLQIAPLGDSAVLLTWDAGPDSVVAESVRAAWQQLRHAGLSHVTGLVPGFASLAVHFDPQHACSNEIQQAIRQVLGEASATAVQRPRQMRIPVCFHPSVALDLGDVCRFAKLSETECLQLLCSTVYTVRMLGFSPGFPYLSGLPEVLAIPRKTTPRLRVAAGSVAIAGGMAGIYPNESPGGWNLIGQTSLRLFDPVRPHPCLLEPGDEVTFVNVTATSDTAGAPR